MSEYSFFKANKNLKTDVKWLSKKHYISRCLYEIDGIEIGADMYNLMALNLDHILNDTITDLVSALQIKSNG